MSKAPLHKNDIPFFAVPKGKLAELVDYGKRHNLQPSKLTLDDYQEIAAKLGIPNSVGGL